MVATDIEYALINQIIFAYVSILLLTIVLWSNRHRIYRAVRIWLRPDLNYDTPTQYHRHSRSHNTTIGGNK